MNQEKSPFSRDQVHDQLSRIGIELIEPIKNHSHICAVVFMFLIHLVQMRNSQKTFIFTAIC